MRLAFLLFNSSFDCQITHFSALHWYDYVSLRLALTQSGYVAASLQSKRFWETRETTAVTVLIRLNHGVDKKKWKWNDNGATWAQLDYRPQQGHHLQREWPSRPPTRAVFYFFLISFSMTDWHPHMSKQVHHSGFEVLAVILNVSSQKSTKLMIYRKSLKI